MRNRKLSFFAKNCAKIVKFLELLQMQKNADGRTQTLQTRMNTDFFKIVQAPVIDMSIGFFIKDVICREEISEERMMMKTST